MSEPGAGSAPTTVGGGAGAMLRSARQAQGLHIAALAASIKVPQAKLEALEAERFADLPDATFTRALAQSVCRVLKIDAAPILSRLPSAGPLALDKVEGGLNTPFRDRPGRGDPIDRLWLRHPVTWLVALLLVGAVAVSFVPTEWLRGLARTAPVASDKSGAGDAGGGSGNAMSLPPSSVAGAIVERIDSPASAVAGSSPPLASTAPVTLPDEPASSSVSVASTSGPVPSSESADAATMAASGLLLRATEASWIQVTEPKGKVLFGRVLAAGETVGLDAAPPLKVRIGNVRGVEVRLRGQPVDIGPATRGNIANLDLR